MQAKDAVGQNKLPRHTAHQTVELRFSSEFPETLIAFNPCGDSSHHGED
jgi:hypothetical protein